MFVFYNYLGVSYWGSSAANYIFGSILSYYLNKKFTFPNKLLGIKILLKFIVDICICYFVAYGIAKPIIRYIIINYDKKIQENMAIIIGMILFVMFNYIGQRFLYLKRGKINNSLRKIV